MDFSKLPIRVVALSSLVWPSHGIVPKELVAPHHIRAIDSDPICIEQLLSGHWFVHDGRHRAIRAQARGDAVIVAYGLALSEKINSRFDIAHFYEDEAA